VSLQAALLTSHGFVLTDVPTPTPGPGQVLVHSLAQGVCGGDPHAYAERARLGDATLLLGHEGTGVVAGVGAGVDVPRLGDIVTTLGGAFAEYYVCPAAHAMVLPPGIEALWALGEPLACCVHGSWRYGVQPGQRIAVIGCGFMGLVCLRLALRQGASYAVAIEPDSGRHAMALRFGAREVLVPAEAESRADLDSAFDLVLEAAGEQSALDLATSLVAEHGRIAIIGYHQSGHGQRLVDMQQWNYKAIDVVNAHVRRDDEKVRAMAEGLSLVCSGEIDLASLVAPYPLSAVETAFADLEAHRAGLFKAVLVPG